MRTITNKYRLANYDKLARKAECDWLAVHILATGEAPDFRENVQVEPGEWLRARVYRADGGHGGILVLVCSVRGQNPDGRAMYLDDFIRENVGQDCGRSAGLLAYRNLAERLQITRRAFWHEGNQPLTSQSI